MCLMVNVFNNKVDSAVKRLWIIFLMTSVISGVTAMPLDLMKSNSGVSLLDSISNNIHDEGGQLVRRRMSHSACPVRVQMVGNALKVDSPEAQLLPIYTHAGAFYLIVRLNKGTNWVGGLPRGKYFINSRLITIN